MAAVPLVVADERGLRVAPEALALLNSIVEPVAIVAVAGPYRSGKSFLLNCLSELEAGPEEGSRGSEPGFAVGSTTNACTRGLWLRASPATGRGQDGGKLRTLWVDSEGLGAVGCDQQHDLHIFSLAVLASSLFVFNSRGAIDEASIASLSFITQLAKNIHVNVTGASDDPDEFCKAFPPFLWVLRDFALQLKDKTGVAMSERQYLEESLKREIGFDEAVTARNRIRMMLTAFFRQRDCVGLQRPVIDEAALAQLSGSDPVPLAALRPGFLQQLEQLRGKIGGMLRPKVLEGASLTGVMFGTLLSEYVRAINAGQVPTIERGWTAVLLLQSQKALANALDVFAGALLAAANTARDDAGELPLSPEAVRRVHEEAHTAARERMAADSLQPEATSTAALEAGMAERWAAFESVNRREWNIRSSAELARLWAPVQDRLRTRDLSSWGELQQAWRAVQAEFRGGVSDETVDVDSVVNEFAATVILQDAGEMLRGKLAAAEEELVECRAQCSRGEAALSAAVAAHAQSMAVSSNAGSAQERALQDQVASLSAALRSAETALVAQKGENDAEMVELRLRSEFRDKEVGRLNKVIERLQEKTHAHVTAMNKELRASNEKCAAQSERLAVVGERLRVAETTLAISELGVRGDERSSRSRSTATAVEQPESPSLAARASEADAAELLQTKAQLKQTQDGLRKAKARLQLHAAEASVAEARAQGEAMASEERANIAAEELRLSQTKAAQLEGEVRAARAEAAALAAENQALRSSLEDNLFSPMGGVDDDDNEEEDDLEGTPRAGELVV